MSFGEIVLCILVADLITGVVHWAEDTYATLGWPLGIGADNIRHHREPAAMCGSFWGRNLYQFVATGVVAAGLILAGLPPAHVLVTCGVASFANEVHAWNHRAKNPAWIRFLQATAIFQTRQQHAQHHRPPYTRAYCVMTNFVNPFADGLRLWRGMERLLACVGIQPQRGSRERLGV